RQEALRPGYENTDAGRTRTPRCRRRRDRRRRTRRAAAMMAPAPANVQYGVVLAGAKAKPSGWPTASLDTGCGHHRKTTKPEQKQPKRSRPQSPRFQVNPTYQMRDSGDLSRVARWSEDGHRRVLRDSSAPAG